MISGITCKAKSLSHFDNALTPDPVVTVMGLQIAVLLGGAVLTERTFEWRGLGTAVADYIVKRDYLAVQGIVTAVAIIVAIISFLIDVIAAIIDPRVGY